MSNTKRGLFFFQAANGIRGLYVTGLHTCVLPICHDLHHERWWTDAGRSFARRYRDQVELDHGSCGNVSRSEERRVGKESSKSIGSDRPKKKVLIASSIASHNPQRDLESY